MNTFQIFIKTIYHIFAYLIAILVVADLLVFFYYPETIWGDVFLATREQTPMTWISAVSLLVIAFSAFYNYLQTKRKTWYILSILFFFFSMDDAVYFHERISGHIYDKQFILENFPTYIWIVLYLPLLVAALGLLIYKLWNRKNLKKNRAILIALTLLAVAIILDLVDGIVQKNAAVVFCLERWCDLAVVHGMRLTEEVVEILGVGILGYLMIQKTVKKTFQFNRQKDL